MQRYATQVRQRPVTGLGKASPYGQVASGHSQRTKYIVQALVGQRMKAIGFRAVKTDPETSSQIDRPPDQQPPVDQPPPVDHNPLDDIPF